MADQLSLHTQILVTLSGQEVPVDVIATTAQELLDTVASLTGQAAAQQAAVNHNPVQGPAPQQAQATPTPAATPAASQPAPQPQQTAQPGPSVADTAPQAAATPSATETAAQPSHPSLTLNDVLAPARQLLQLQNGEEALRKILAATGAEAISQADPTKYGHIKWAVEQVLAGQDLDAVLSSLA